MDDSLAAKIRERAYLLWEREGRPEGKALEHWLCAEAELCAEQPMAASGMMVPTRETTVAAADRSTEPVMTTAEPKPS
ncbi:MAG: hypothetical protein BroJett024_43650 [Alphaproteobacteria bacterium]|nr:MAG: hypothetical protein BroJett024_43650 [Alphaproteobacteria bacterium]